MHTSQMWPRSCCSRSSCRDYTRSPRPPGCSVDLQQLCLPANQGHRGDGIPEDGLVGMAAVNEPGPHTGFGWISTGCADRAGE